MIDRKNLDMRRIQSQGAEFEPAGKTIRGLTVIPEQAIAGTQHALKRLFQSLNKRLLMIVLLIPIVIVLMGIGIPDTAQAQTRTHKHKHIAKAKHPTAVPHTVHKTQKIQRQRLQASLRHIPSKPVMHHKKNRQARLMAKHRHAQTATRTGTYNIIAAHEPTPVVDPWMPKELQEKEFPTVDTPTDAVTARVLATAQNYLGSPYRYGGTTPEGFDCSGFVRHVFGENGITLNRSSREQILQGKHVALDAIRPGDLIFFGKQRRSQCRIEHVGLYLGKGRFIHAASKHTGYVTISELGSESYRNRMVSARRIIESP